VASWAVTFVAAFWILAKRERMLCFDRPRIAEVLDSWGRILHVGLPAAGTNLVAPVSMAVLTRIVAVHGDYAVAAFGVGTRIEALALIGVTSLGAALGPFVGQNFGAKNCARIRAAVRYSFIASMLYGLGMALLLALAAGPLARAFNDQPQVQAYTLEYLRLVPISYGLFGFALLVGSTFNAVNRPLNSALLAVVRLLVLAVPLAWAFGRVWGPTGVFAAACLANLGVGGLAWWLVRRFVDDAEERFEAEQPVPAT
jgi:Na+-driven multidrug efflux pump